jgi:nicotinamidase-related amidase
VHVVVDMQRVFAEPTDWHVAALADVLPSILALVQAHPHQCLFTRFVTPPTIAEASGDWQRFYARWPSVLRDRMDATMLDLIEPLARLVPPAEAVDKKTYSAFPSTAFLGALSRRDARTLVLSGVETDVCVLATALDAVDRGLHVVVAADAVASSSPSGHRAALEVLRGRFDQQIDLATVSDVIAAWTGQ